MKKSIDWETLAVFSVSFGVVTLFTFAPLYLEHVEKMARCST